MSSRLDRIHRIPERARHELADRYSVLDAGHRVGTLSTVLDGEPWAVPLVYARVEDRVLLHGSTGAGALRHVAQGQPAAFSVVHMDGLIYAHTMFNQSAMFLSAVVRGHLRPVPQEELSDALTAFTEDITPGRSSEVPTHTKKHLAGTQLLALDLSEARWTVKVRDAVPTAPEPGEPCAPDLWRGTIPIHSVYGTPIPAPGVAPGTPLSPSIQRLVDRVAHAAST